MTENSEEIISWKHTCGRCYHWWISMLDRPKKCPSCKSPYWDKPYVRAMKGPKIASEWDVLNTPNAEVFFPYTRDKNGLMDRDATGRRARSLTQWLRRKGYKVQWLVVPGGWHIKRVD